MFNLCRRFCAIGNFGNKQAEVEVFPQFLWGYDG